MRRKTKTTNRRRIPRACLDAQSLKRVDKPSVKTASLRGFLKGMKIGKVREKRDR